MLEVNLPGGEAYKLEHLVLDFNGTIAMDGRLIHGVSERLQLLSNQLKIYVITADTNGSVHRECRDLPVEVHVIGKKNQAEDKLHFIQSLSKGTIAMGNGANDGLMFEGASLAIAILGDEGLATPTLLKSDIIVKQILDGFDLLLRPHRLIATLRR